MQIRLSPSPQLLKHLISRGLPRDILRMRPFEMLQYTTTITSQVDGLKAKKVMKQAQLEHFDAVMEKPFGRPYIYVIGSSPNDGKAKQVAATIMKTATQMQLQEKNLIKQTRGRQTPLWHMVTGAWADRLRDARVTDEPSMLILSNITSMSTNSKLEKVRDLLEMYSNIPRIVVVTGEDPVTFANKRLMIPVNHVLNLSTARKVVL